MRNSQVAARGFQNLADRKLLSKEKEKPGH